MRLLCIQEDIGFAEFDVGDYENYAVRNRYPHDNEIPDFAQVQVLYSGASYILSFVEDIIF